MKSDVLPNNNNHEFISNYQSFGKIQSLVQGINMDSNNNKIQNILDESSYHDHEDEDLSNLGIVIHE